MALLKKSLLVSLIVAFLLSVFSVSALANSAQFAYRINGDFLEIAACYGEEESISVPENIDGYEVTAINNRAFQRCEALKVVSIPATVTEIADNAFAGREGITVRGEKGSYAQKYCQANNISFQEGYYEDSQLSAVWVFPDVDPNSWYGSYIDDLYHQNIVNGNEKGLFMPNSNTTRAEFVKMLAVASGDDMEVYSRKPQFKDVKTGEWYTSYVVWATEKGLINGYEDGTFRPLNLVNRAEMMVMQKRYVENITNTTLPVIVSEMIFSDSGSIGSWAKDAVRELQMAGIINGKGENMLEPAIYSTRAEAAKMISCFLALLREDNSAKEIKGLMFVDGEVTYWQNGSLQTSKEAAAVNDGVLMIPLSVYSQYLDGSVSDQGSGSVQITGKDGRYAVVTTGTTTAAASTGQTITLNKATVNRNGEVFVDIFSLASFFGDKGQVAADATAYFVYPHDRTIDESNWLQGSISLIASKKPYVTVNEASYGQSGRGRSLTYTAITPSNYNRTMLFVFEQHGFEDIYAKDGQVLVNAANTVINHFSKLDADALNGVRIVVVSSANPDGLAEGYTHNGPGRCTIVGGVDMNRDWPTSTYQRSTSARNYTLYPLSCKETQSLNNLINTLQPSVMLDIHGWLNGVYGDRGLARIFNNGMALPSQSLFSSTSGLMATDVTNLSDAELEEAYLSGLVGFRGYLAGYGYEKGIRSALVELKSPYAPNVNGLINCLNTIVATY